jgi:hypothetical protein
MLVIFYDIHAADMSDNPSQPFGHDTIELHAVFVAADDDGNPGSVSDNDVAETLGHNAVRIPAVIVSGDGDPPGYPYVKLGKISLAQRPEASAPPGWAGGSSGAPNAGIGPGGHGISPQSDTDDPAPSTSQPPVPSLARGVGNPIGAAVRALHGAAAAPSRFRKKGAPDDAAQPET